MIHNTKQNETFWVQTRDLPIEAGDFNPVSLVDQSVVFKILIIIELFVLKFEYSYISCATNSRFLHYSGPNTKDLVKEQGLFHQL